MGNYSDWLYGNRPIPYTFMEQPMAPNLSMEPPAAEAKPGGIGDMLKNLSVAKVGDIALKNALPLALAGRMVSMLGGAGNNPFTRTQDMVVDVAKANANQKAITRGNVLAPATRPTSAASAGPTFTDDPLATTKPDKWLSFFNQR